jgi:phosphohistidine phosphatase
VSSDAVRARVTAEAVAETARYAGKILLHPNLYLASSAHIVAVLQALGETQTDRVMIVGHNPGLEDLVAQLTGESEDLPTAALAHVALPFDQWRDLDVSTRGTLLMLWRPKDLR